MFKSAARPSGLTGMTGMSAVNVAHDLRFNSSQKMFPRFLKQETLFQGPVTDSGLLTKERLCWFSFPSGVLVNVDVVTYWFKMGARRSFYFGSG